MIAWVKETMARLGYPGIALLMFLENIIPPIPSELIMPLAGFLSAEGRLSFAGVVVAGTVGAVLGALPFYYLGRLAGETRLKAWADRYGRWVAVSSDDIDRVQRWFARHGGKAVFLGRLVPGIRSYISIPAGLARMPLLRFLLYTIPGVALWSTLLAFAGRLLGSNYERVGQYLGPVGSAVLGLSVLSTLVWIVVRRRRTRHAGP
ncbi:MAG: DedA family protein [Chloroflexales bacterium]|nr:DedA family protein [Chloroflexales bacterium]